MFTAHLLEHLCTVKVAKYFTRFLSVFLPFFGSHDNGNGIEDRMTPMARYFARKTWQTCREDSKKRQKVEP